MKPLTIVATVFIFSVLLFNKIGHTEESTQLHDDPLLKKAEETVSMNYQQATVRLVQSSNQHLGGIIFIPQPVKAYRYYAAIVANRMADPQIEFLAVAQDGTVLYPLKMEQLVEHFRQQDKTSWKDSDYLNAATLYVHLMSVSNEDGWKVLVKPEDFTSINMNMESVGPGVKQQQAAAQQIKAPVFDRPKSEEQRVGVTFYSWHVIGGSLRKWTITFDENVTGKSKNLGSFGGGGYD